MTVKADSHFVDCDKKVLTAETWDSIRDGSSSESGNPKIVYISDNGGILGIPFDFENQTTLFLDAGGEARNVGGGTVGLPCANHPFSSGNVIQIIGSTNYDGTPTLTSGTTSTELQFTDTYQAETFNGDETVIQFISLNAGVGRMDYDEDGVLYYGQNILGGQCVDKITDGVSDTTFINPTTAFTGSVCTGVKVSSDSAYLYVQTDGRRLWKFDLSDGSEVWNVATGAGSLFYLDIDSDDNVYSAAAGFIRLSAGTFFNPARKFAAADGSVTQLDFLASGFAIVVDNDMGKVISNSNHFWATTDTAYYQNNLFLTDLDGGNQISIQLGTALGPVSPFNLWHGPIVNTGCIVTHENFIYVLIVSEATLYKLDSNLNVIDSTTDIPPYAIGLFIDTEGNIAIVNQDFLVNRSDVFWFYDTDFNFIATIDGFGVATLRLWTSSAFIQGDVIPVWNFFPYNSTVSEWSITQNRTVAYPQDFSHLEGEEVQVLGDGNYLGTEVVSGGAIVLDDDTTVNHVGLKFTSKVQTTKTDGETEVKRISRIIPDVYKSVGGDYGESEDDLYSMVLRDENDPMDTTGALHSGYIELPFNGSYNRQGDIFVTQDEPFPMHLLGFGVNLSKEAI